MTQPDSVGFSLEIWEDDEEDGPEIIAPLRKDFDPDDPLPGFVDEVLHAHPQYDGLEARVGDDEHDDELILGVQDWRSLSPDDPKGDILNVRLSSAIVAKMDHLISRTRGEFWRRRSDYLREAVWMYTRSVLQALQSSDPILLTLLSEAELGGRAEFHATRRARLEKALGDTQSYLTDLVNLDDYEEVHRVLMDTAVRIRRLHVQSWKRQWLLNLNALPILQVCARMLVMNGWDIPLEFYPAAGKSIPSASGSGTGSAATTTPSPPHPGVIQDDPT